MAKAPLATTPDDARKDRRTRIASGPAPMPAAPQSPDIGATIPSPPRISQTDATVPAPSRLPSMKSQPTAIPSPPPAPRKTATSLKKTQMHMMGAPPVPKPASVAKTKLPPTDDSLPSSERTVVGPAPLPPTPKKSPIDDLFEDELPTSIRPLRDTVVPTSAPFPTPTPTPTPTLRPPSRDTQPSAEQRNGPTHPPSEQPPKTRLGGADTQPNLSADLSQGHTGSSPTEEASARRESKVGTQIHGTEGLAIPTRDAPKIRLVPGRVIPGTRYEIRRWLGEGGMGVVYEVSHVDIERRSALKILRFDLSQQAQMAQVFRDEARAVSRLGSPNIVEVYDFGELHDGRLFFAMELLEGIDLVPTDEQSSMEPARFIAILRQVAKGLAKAHEAGVVHRDVKPENIIISEIDGRVDTVKIVDFGISAMLAAGKSKAGIAGTPHYMAPEQILGDDFDHRLDIYALGCTAYEMIVGQPPFDSEDVEVLLKLQVNEPPVPPRQRRPELEIPAELDNVIMKCLAKRPEDRYANMADFEAALCEAQIAAGLVTTWDDLAVPPLPDEERYARIVARMPSATAPTTTKRSWFWPIVAVTSTFATVGLAAFLIFGRQPSEAEVDQVEALTIEARSAASKLSWVIPPPHIEDDETGTALRKIEELELLEGNAEDMADERGAELRQEFATTLIGHGDDLWEVARDFSRQYYIWALMFDPANELALTRADIDPVTLENFRRKALAGDFSEFDRFLAGSAAFGVMEDADEKAALAVAMNENMPDAEAMSPQARISLERGLSSAGLEGPKPRRGSGAQPVRSKAKPEPEVEIDDPDELIVDDPVEEVEDPRAEAGRKKRRQKVSAGFESKAKRAPQRSKALTKEADAKRKKGHRGEAKTLYGQAIAADPSNGSAHLGLALVHFDQGSYHQARKAAQRAVRHSPRNGKAHKTLGDAFYKEFRYQEALDAYKEARSLGVKNVKSRIADVEKKLGK